MISSSSNNSDYEIIDELSITPELLSYTSSSDNIISPSQISESNSKNIPLTLSPIQNLSPPQSPLYQSILEGCEEAGITSVKKEEKEKEKEENIIPKKNKCILCRILEFIKSIFSSNESSLTDDNYSSQFSHFSYMG